MVLSLVEDFGAAPMKVAADLVLAFVATMADRTSSQWTVGWVPGLSNAFNAAVATALTEAIGWAAVDRFESGGGLGAGGARLAVRFRRCLGVQSAKPLGGIDGPFPVLSP